ncbi:hypothetical protein [Anaerosinus gibii]|uniref:Uncharacterized protein n=1 Tax=Selenobaculum gibii TaxID=3054208 RepID=A0A9Y2AFQ8_9FIRM|nr:hypothetical protein [Selenobaculum gbiensis]WIW70825.1 hypothetical protein P3F81_00430 [Selenobaculum gbiensis]
MDVRELLYRRFIAPMESKKNLINRIGMEFAYPLVCLGNKSNKMIVKYLFEQLIKRGFMPLYCDKKELIGVEKKFTARIFLDASYNCLSIALAPIVAIHEADRTLQEVFKLFRTIVEEQALLIDQSIHPLHYSLPANFIADDEWMAKRKFIEKYSPQDFSGRADFFAFITAIKTHLNFMPQEIPYAFTVLSKLDFAELFLFANSPIRTKQGWFRSAKYYYYTRSGLALAGLSGSMDQSFRSIQDVLLDYAQRGLFLRRRENCQFFIPVRLGEYFKRSEYGAIEEDLDCFFSYKNTELEQIGTVKRQVSCVQPFSQTFVPVAFVRGIVAKLGQADELVKRFLRDNQITSSNNQLCEMAARGVLIGSRNSLYEFLGGLWQLAIDSARMRGVGDEAYLTCFDEKFSALMNWYENKIMDK